MLHFPSTLRLGGRRVGCSHFCEALPSLVLLLDQIQLTLKPPATLLPNSGDAELPPFLWKERILTLSNVSLLMHWTFTDACLISKVSSYAHKENWELWSWLGLCLVSAAPSYFSLLGENTKAIGRHCLPSLPSQKLLLLEMCLCEYILTLSQSQVN